MAVAEFHSRVMASEVHVIAVVAAGLDGPSVERAGDRVFRRLEDLERVWSRFIASSDISRLNSSSRYGATIEVDPSTITLIEAMIEGHVRTGGRFDPTLLRPLVDAGYASSVEDPAARCILPPPGHDRPSLLDLRHEAGTNRVTVPPGLLLDPGGIGKGLAADMAVASLLDDGFEGALVSIGGDLFAGGTPPDPDGWRVDVEHVERTDGILCSLTISGGGVATSSIRSRRWLHHGVERHHQIDPATRGCSDTDLAAVTVFAPAGWLAEAHATAALAAGSDGAIEHLEANGLSGIAVSDSLDDARVFTTGDLAGVALDAGLVAT